MDRLKNLLKEKLRRLSKRLKKYPRLYSVALYGVTLLRRFKRFIKKGANPLRFKISSKKRKHSRQR